MSARTATRSIGRSDERGAAFVELMIVLPIIVVLALGAIEWSQYSARRAAVGTAAAAGARIAGLPNTTPDQVRAAVVNELPGFAASDPSLTVTLATASGASCGLHATGPRIIVTVHARTRLSAPILGQSTITLAGRAISACA